VISAEAIAEEDGIPISSDFLIPAENDSAPLGVCGESTGQPRVGLRTISGASQN
jgi:hypothetical protein